MLTYHLSDYNEKPLYKVLYKCIREDIINGNILAGVKLPSKRSLASHLKISVTTVENAYEMLLQEGYIYSRPSSGFFASDMMWPDMDDNIAKGNMKPRSVKGTDTGYTGGRSGAEKTGSGAEKTGYGAEKMRSGAEKMGSGAEKDRFDEEEFKLDFRGSMAGLKLFPISIWTKLMRQVLSESDLKLLQTIPWNGLYSLRYAISDYLRQYKGIFVNPDLIIIGAGTEYLYSRLLQLFSYNSIIGFEDPGYVKLSRIAANLGILPQFIKVDDNGLCVEDLKKSKAGAVHLSPANHFPTGIVMTDERRRELIDWVHEDPYRFIIEDDYDSEFLYKNQVPKTLFSMDNGNQVIYMNTFSKSLVPSIRISYMILPKSLLDLYRKSQEFYSCTVSSFEQMTLARFISDGYFDRHINRLKNYYRQKRDLVIDIIKGSDIRDIVEIKELDAGTHLMIRVKTTLSDDEIKKKTQALNIHVPMLSDYCQSPKINDLHTVLLNFAGMSEDDIERAIETIDYISK